MTGLRRMFAGLRGGSRRRASYTYEVEEGVVYVVDSDDGSGPSVTNDAEAVVEDLVRAGAVGPGARVLYRDSMGRWDEIVVKDGRFAGFRPLGGDGAPGGRTAAPGALEHLRWPAAARPEDGDG